MSKATILKFFKLPFLWKVKIIFAPIHLFLIMPRAWVRSLWESRVLLNGQWDRYMGFHPINSIAYLFYRTQWINIRRYGRFNRSPIIGLGNYQLSRWFHLSLLASYVYSNAGAVTTLFCTLILVFSHLVWAQSVDFWWALSLILLFFLSSTAYSMAFARQNYQILGWAWYPIALWATLESQYFLALFFWWAASAFSITAIFFAVPLVIYIAYEDLQFSQVFVLLPAVITVGFRIFSPLFAGNFSEAILSMAKLIGVSRSNVRDSREMENYGLSTWYFTFLYLTSIAMVWLTLESAPMLMLIGLCFFVINQRFIRVADVESVVLVNAFLYMATALSSEPSGVIILAGLILLNPFGKFMDIQSFAENSKFGAITIFKPIDRSNLIALVVNFLKRTEVSGRLLFCYDDPSGKYENIFDGYRNFHELILNAAAEIDSHVMPDWYAVSETNYQGAPQIWGRSLDAAIQNCEILSASYIVIYQVGNSELDEKWTKDFQLLSVLDWSEPKNLALIGEGFWGENEVPPKWFLLSANKAVNTGEFYNHEG